MHRSDSDTQPSPSSNAPAAAPAPTTAGPHFLWPALSGKLAAQTGCCRFLCLPTCPQNPRSLARRNLLTPKPPRVMKPLGSVGGHVARSNTTPNARHYKRRCPYQATPGPTHGGVIPQAPLCVNLCNASCNSISKTTQIATQIFRNSISQHEHITLPRARNARRSPHGPPASPGGEWGSKSLGWGGGGSCWTGHPQ